MNTEIVTAEKPALPAVSDQEPGNLLHAIVTLAKDSAVDVAKLDALLKMQERLEGRDAEREFTAAFVRLSAKMPRVKKNGTISLGTNKGSIPFAKWEDMDKIIRPLLNEEGFALSFDSAPRPGDGGGLVVTGRLERGGHARTASIPLPLDTGPGRNNLQAMGSTLSYGKRYCAEMLLNIVREGDDDDGKRGGAQFITQDDIGKLRKLIADTGTDEDRFLQFFQVTDLASLTVENLAPARNMLLAKRKPA